MINFCLASTINSTLILKTRNFINFKRIFQKLLCNETRAMFGIKMV
jgi:hypothetical protein